MQVFIMVIDDLYSFALQAFLAPFRLFYREYQHTLEDIPVMESENIELVSDEHVGVVEEEPISSFKKIEEVIKTHESSVSIGGEKNTVMYAGGADIPVYKNPTKEFDAVIATLGYGDMVMVLEQKGRWAHIVYKELNGWALREDLVDRAAHVYPRFVIGEPNNEDDPNAVRVRAIIGDTFGGGKGELPLQAGEYILYRLYRKGLHIEWPDIRPRTPGAWHTILKGKGGVHSGVTPKTGAIMEYMITEDLGHVAFVEAVFPDETINISEANYPDSGIYNERILTRNEWLELKPIFIQVS